MNKLSCLVVTTLYPNAVQFRHGVFVETRIKQLRATGEIDVKVLAPVPWFPFKSKYFPAYSQWVDVPSVEVRDGIEVYHPRYLIIPKIGMLLTPWFLAISLLAALFRLQRQGLRFDFIDAHYYYPDGVAAALVAKLLGKKLIITARGTDINLIPNFSLPRKLILWAARQARFNLAVCEALRQRMVEIGVESGSTGVYRNGVDLELFKPLDRQALRRHWGVEGPLLLSVGYLIERKGHHLIIEAMKSLPDYQLFIVGGGEWRQKLENQVAAAELQGCVRFLGEISHQHLPELYNCADALVLASDREGWANVLLESMACGTPVAATRIWGTPEVVQTPEAGVLCEQRSAAGIAAAIRQLFANYPDRAATRRYAEQFSWEETTSGLLKLYRQLLAAE